MRVSDIRAEFVRLYKNEEFTIDRTGAKTIEILGATFDADQDWIIRPASEDYIKRELEWYASMSRNVNDIPGETPTIWKQISTPSGFINSNYGWCIFSEENGSQYAHVKQELIMNRDSRRAVMLYNRPTMHTDYNEGGMNDFMCTFSNVFFIRNNELISHFLMRSNDAVFGYGNDVAWAKHVQARLCKDLQIVYPDLKIGKLIWTASNIHVYERHFKFLENL